MSAKQAYKIGICTVGGRVEVNMSKQQHILDIMRDLETKLNRGVSALELGKALGVDRTNASRYLNQLHMENKVEKLGGRPVLYRTCREKKKEAAVSRDSDNSLNRISMIYPSLQQPIQQAKAAILYPPRGLHTLVLGETGVGKSMFAELMYKFAVESGVLPHNAPFVCFNCADYADNPQLVISQIFGVKKGAYTGADKDREGLLNKADGGMLLLDEVHRLSPQGQEMLFTFIDKGCFSPLGETDRTTCAGVQIIAATTEEPQSYLLNTFTRRIPMIIKLPSLRDRGLTERYYLVESFIRQESKRIGKSIYVNKDSIIALLLYDCPNNIGQLKSDIQLACARAFVNYKSKDEEYILVTLPDLPQHVKKGIMKIPDKRNEMDYLLKNKGDILRYSYKEEPALQSDAGHNGAGHSGNEDFYDIIEKKIETLKLSGIREEEISHIINMDIESHFKKYIGELPDRIGRNDISKILSTEVLELVDGILELAQARLGRSYDEKIYFGLSLHINGFIERIKKGIRIFHPKLNLIRVEYPEEFLTAMEAAKIMDGSLGIHTPLDEIGYLAMFLASNPLELGETEKNRVGVLVIMHGNSTASSMAEVCNTLIDAQYAVALDMPLSMDPQHMYDIAKETVIKMNTGRGVILLVDMGSLVNFGNMISEETGIVVKTIASASTPNVIDACSKAMLGRDIYYIYDSCKGIKTPDNHNAYSDAPVRKNIILTACFTGEGASEKLKGIIEKALGTKHDIEVIPLEIMNRNEFLGKVEKYREHHRVLALVSTIDINVNGIPFIPALDVFGQKGLEQLDSIVAVEETYSAISQSLKKHINAIDIETVLYEIRNLINDIEASLGLQLKNEVEIGIALHISFLLEKLKSGGTETVFRDLELYRNQHARELLTVNNCLRPLGKSLSIKIGENESAYICKMFLSNDESK